MTPRCYRCWDLEDDVLDTLSDLRSQSGLSASEIIRSLIAIGPQEHEARKDLKAIVEERDQLARECADLREQLTLRERSVPVEGGPLLSQKLTALSYVTLSAKQIAHKRST